MANACPRVLPPPHGQSEWATAKSILLANAPNPAQVNARPTTDQTYADRTRQAPEPTFLQLPAHIQQHVAAAAIQTFHPLQPETALCGFRATEHWHDAQSMINGETAVNRSAIFRSMKTVVYQDLPRKPIIVLHECYTTALKLTRATDRCTFVPGHAAKNSLTVDLGLTTTHILVPNDTIANVTSADPTIMEAVQHIVNNPPRRTPRYPTVKHYVQLPPNTNITNITGATLIPMQYVTHKTANRFTLRYTTKQACTNAIHILQHTHPSFHTHRVANTLRVVAPCPLTWPLLNTIKQATQQDNQPSSSCIVFTDDFLRPSTITPSESGLTDNTSTTDDTDTTRTRQPHTPRYALIPAPNSLLSPDTVRLIAAALNLVPAKTTSSTMHYFLLELPRHGTPHPDVAALSPTDELLINGQFSLRRLPARF